MFFSWFTVHFKYSTEVRTTQAAGLWLGHRHTFSELCALLQDGQHCSLSGLLFNKRGKFEGWWVRDQIRPDDAFTTEASRCQSRSSSEVK